MPIPHNGAAEIWKDTDGGTPYMPQKPQIRDWGEYLEKEVEKDRVFHYASRDALATAIDAGDLDDGATVLVRGHPYLIDATATGAESALSDLGKDGARRLDGIENLYIASFFRDQNEQRIFICTSLDGVNFATLTSAVLPVGASDSFTQRDPSITWFNGSWWIFGTGAAEGSHDFVVYKSTDLTTWTKYQVALGGGPYYSATTPFPGGTSPASSIWAPEPYIQDGKLYIALAIRYGADITNAFGNTGVHMKMFVSECTNPATNTFNTPQAVDFGADTMSLIDMSTVKIGANLFAAVKDDEAKKVRTYTSASIYGPWAHVQTLGADVDSIEGPSLYTQYYYSLGGGAKKSKLFMAVDENRTGPADANPNILLGRPWYFSAEVTGDVVGAFGTMKPLYFDTRVRHGKIVNLADLPLEAAASLSMVQNTTKRTNMETLTDLGTGDVTIRPQPNETYVVVGGNNSVNLTIEDGPADSFRLLVASTSDGTGISVLDSGDVAGPVWLGYGTSNDMYMTFTRREDTGQYYPEAHQIPANVIPTQNVEIANGEIDIGPQELVLVEVEGGPGGGLTTDDLKTINGGINAQRIIIRIKASGRSVVIKNGTGGNIQTASSADVVLSGTRNSISLYKAGNIWRQYGGAAD